MSTDVNKPSGRGQGMEGGASSAGERYFVTDGQVTVGPIEGALLVRGIHAGRVPLEALVWSTGWKSWRSVSEYAGEIGVLPSREDTRASSIMARVSDLGSLQLPADEAQASTLCDCSTLKEAGTEFLRLASALTGAQCGWIHIYSRQAGGAMVTLEGVGPRAPFGVSRTIDPSDHALLSAREGRMVLSEPIPGVVGAAVIARLVSTGVTPCAALMIPVVCDGKLLLMLELGSTQQGGLDAASAAATERMARDLSKMARERGWNQE